MRFQSGCISRRLRTPAHAPDSESPGVQLIHYATVHRSQLLASFLLFAVGLAVLMVFAAGMYCIIRRKEGNDGWLAMASLASVVAERRHLRCRHRAVHGGRLPPDHDPAVARAFWDAGWLAYNTAGFGFTLGSRSSSLATLTYRVLPLWTAWIGVPVGLISFVGPFAVEAGTGPFSHRAGSPWSSASLSLHGCSPSLGRLAILRGDHLTTGRG